MPRLRTEEAPEALIVFFTDAKIQDEDRIQQIGMELLGSADKAASRRRMILDFTGVEFMNSLMIGKLIGLNKHCRAAGTELVFRNVASTVLEVLRITRLTRIFHIEGYQEEEPERPAAE